MNRTHRTGGPEKETFNAIPRPEHSDPVEDLNFKLFAVLNAPAHPGALAYWLAVFAAKGLIVLSVPLLGVLWVKCSPRERGGLVTAGVSLLAGMSVNGLINLSWYHPRPSVLGIGHTLASHGLDSSFPSDHATFLWSLGFALLLSASWRAWGALLVGVGFLTAWARVYLGLHFPLDMAGSLGVALFSAALAQALRPHLEPRLLKWANAVSDRVLRVLGLPPQWPPGRKASR